MAHFAARRNPQSGRTLERIGLAARLAGLGPPGLGERLLELAEDHAAGAGLQHARDSDFHGAADLFAAGLDHDHRAVVEIADPLARLFALLDNAHLQVLTRQAYRLEGVGHVV